MMVVTTDAVPGCRIVRTLGLVRGNTIRCRHLGKDILAAFKNRDPDDAERRTREHTLRAKERITAAF